MRSRCALITLFLTLFARSAVGTSEAETAPPPAASGGTDGGAAEAEGLVLPPEDADGGSAGAPETGLPAAPVPEAPAVPGLPPAAAAASRTGPVAAAADAGPELQLPEDKPPESENELSVQAGWNSDAPFGLRYLRHIESTDLSFGAGAGAFTLWGPKVSVIVRYQPFFGAGLFAQSSAGFTQGGAFSQRVTTTSGQQATASLLHTPSRTIDLFLGWRYRWAGSFLEAAAGYSFNLEGTVLQDPTKTQVDFDLKDIQFRQAGGPAGAVAYGWLF
jgi:hypothetical protein